MVLEGVVLEGVVLSELPQGEVAGRREGPHCSLCPSDVLTGDAHWLNPRRSQRARKRMGWVKEATAFQGTCSWKGQRMNTAWWRHWRADDTLTARAPSPGVGLCCSQVLQPSPSPSTLPRLQCHPHADDPHIKLCLETHPCMFSYGLNGMSLSACAQLNSGASPPNLL